MVQVAVGRVVATAHKFWANITSPPTPKSPSTPREDRDVSNVPMLIIAVAVLANSSWNVWFNHREAARPGTHPIMLTHHRKWARFWEWFTVVNVGVCTLGVYAVFFS